MKSIGSADAWSVADVICRTIEHGLTITGAHIGDGGVTVIHARPLAPLPFYPTCGAEGVLRDHVTRELTDLPVAGFPTRLHVRLSRYRCEGAACRQKIFQHQHRLRNPWCEDDLENNEVDPPNGLASTR